jgi:hypothetical protein
MKYNYDTPRIKRALPSASAPSPPTKKRRVLTPSFKESLRFPLLKEFEMEKEDFGRLPYLVPRRTCFLEQKTVKSLSPQRRSEASETFTKEASAKADYADYAVCAKNYFFGDPCFAYIQKQDQNVPRELRKVM